LRDWQEEEGRATIIPLPSGTQLFWDPWVQANLPQRISFLLVWVGEIILAVNRSLFSHTFSSHWM